MLRLITCEFWKLKRKKFILLIVFSALLFPIPLTVLVLHGNIGDINAFDSLYQMLLCLGEPIMLPCIIGIIAAMLFFMERDYDTLKNTRTIPVPLWKIASAKIAVLYLFGLIYAFTTLLSSMLGGVLAGSNLGNIPEKIVLSVITALLYTSSALPIVVAIVSFNRSYIFSVILTFFYTMSSFMLGFMGLFTSSKPVLKVLTNIVPAPIIYRWQASRMVSVATEAYAIWKPYFLPLWLVALNILIITILSYLAIIKIYRMKEI